MKKEIFGTLQRVGRSFMLPIAVLPIAGIFLGIGSCLTNSATIASLNMEAILGPGTTLNQILTLLMDVGDTIFDNLPLIFAASVASGMAKKSKEVAVISSIIAFFVMHSTIHSLLVIDGIVVGNNAVVQVVEGTLTNVCGFLSLQMGVFGGIIVGLGVSILHNRYYQIQLPDFISFFEGERFVPIISTIVFIIVGIIMFFVWPSIQNCIYGLGKLIASSGYGGTFVYGIVKRALIPFGLHHVFYMPFYQTPIGGTINVGGTIISGAQNIFFAQLSDPTLKQFSIEATKYFSGEYLVMMFGFPGAALAMYHCAKDESKNAVKSLFLSAALTSILTGITEPIEFTYIFVAPMLFIVSVFLAGTAFVIAHMLEVTIGYTFSCGLVDFTIFGILQGNSKTHWIYIVLLGVMYFIIYYVVFTILIKKYDLKTPGREDGNKITILNKKNLDYSFDKSLIDPQVQLIIKGMGGRNNFSDLDCCITRLRAVIKDSTLVSEASLKQAGAAAVMLKGNAIQIIFGPKASSLKTKIDDYIANVPEAYDEEKTISLSRDVIELGNIVDGEVCPIEDCIDEMFACKLLGDGIMIKPKHGLVVAPCDGIISMIYPTKHALGIKLDNGVEVLIHFGINTVKLNGQGFDIFGKINQKINKGDVLWNADLEYIKENAVDDCILVVVTSNVSLEKQYGNIKCGDTILKISS